MKKLKGNLHTHTIFSDGKKTPEEIISTYISLGYDFIAITDHSLLINQDEYFSGIPDSNDLIVLKGMEISEELLNNRHIGRIFGDNEILHILNHPSLYGLSIEDVLNDIEKVSPKYKIDCIEVSHYGFYTSEYDTDLIPLPKIVSDDAHRDGMYGKAWIEVESDKNKDDILKNIKKGNFTKHFE